MTIKFPLSDNQPDNTFGSLEYGRVFRLPEDSTYYMKTPPVGHCGTLCNHINLSTGLHVTGLDSQVFVIPVTLEAKEVNA